jgi:hypothetical protein
LGQSCRLIGRAAAGLIQQDAAQNCYPALNQQTKADITASVVSLGSSDQSTLSNGNLLYELLVGGLK